MSDAASVLPRLKIVVVEDDPTIRQLLRRTLTEQLGHEIVGEADTGPEMVELVLEVQPDLVITDIHLPGHDGLEALRQIAQERAVAAVAITADRDAELVARALGGPVMAYLVKPFDPPQLHAALQVAWARFRDWRSVTSENASLKQSLQDRKAIERAKGLLMTRHEWSEAEAFRRLQRTAMNRRLSMAQLAQAVLNSEAVELDPV